MPLRPIISPRPQGILALRLGRTVGWALKRPGRITSGYRVFPLGTRTESFEVAFRDWLSNMDLSRVAEVGIEDRPGGVLEYAVGVRVLKTACDRVPVPVTLIEMHDLKLKVCGPHATPRMFLQEAKRHFKDQEIDCFEQAAALWLAEVIHEYSDPDFAGCDSVPRRRGGVADRRVSRTVGQRAQRAGTAGTDDDPFEDVSQDSGEIAWDLVQIGLRALARRRGDALEDAEG